MKLNPVVKEFLRMVRYPIQYLFLRGVYSRIRQLEYRAFNRRYFAVEQISEYLVGAQIEGDYCEFGVWEGVTFIHAYQSMARLFRHMRFIALDSFEGLPEPKGLDAEGGYTSHFYKGQFASSEKLFLKNIKKNRLDLSRVGMVKGWFNESLSPESGLTSEIHTVAVAWIDCDLYESTIPVLDFLASHLTQGSVIAFDDWHCYRNHPDFGQQRAVREWLDKNPQIQLAEMFSFGWNGMVFTVTSC